MKKADELRRAYKRSDFTALERGKFHREAVKGSSVVVLDPKLAKVFPDSKAVNAALTKLLDFAEEASRLTKPSKAAARKRAAA